SPALDPTTSKLSQYAHHVRLVYESRADIAVSYRPGWMVQYRRRLQGVDVTSKSFTGATADAREVVRRYHLEYAPTAHASVLRSVQMEGRCAAAVQENASGELPGTSCDRLPKLRFDYQHVDGGTDGLTDQAGKVFEPISERVRDLSGSPTESLGAGLAGLMD